MPITPLYPCSRCKKEFNFNSIKYDTDRSLICLGCFDKQQELKNKEIKSEKPEDHGEKKYICVNCRFNFSVKKGSPKGLHCPYCGKEQTMLIKKYKDENDLIEDSMDPRFDH